jgi:hypothetical protein
MFSALTDRGLERSLHFMAGQRGGVNFDPTMIFVLVLCFSCFRNVPGRLPYKIKSFALKTVFWGPRLAVDSYVTSLCKNLVKNRKTNFRRQAIQEPIFSVANADCEGGDGDYGYGDCIFFGHLCVTQP